MRLVGYPEPFVSMQIVLGVARREPPPTCALKSEPLKDFGPSGYESLDPFQ